MRRGLTVRIKMSSETRPIYQTCEKAYSSKTVNHVLENLFSCCYSCITWDNAWSTVFEINFGVRQGSVLSPFLFAVYLDDLSKLCSPFDACYIILYADDILLI